MNYKWVKLGEIVRRLADNANIPVDPNNTDYQQFIKDGGQADPEDPPTPLPTPDQLEVEVQQLLNGGDGFHVDWKKLIKAKFISDLAFRLGVNPNALTPAQLLAERNRIAAIYKVL